MRRAILLWVLLAQATGVTLFAQDISASIGGVIVDPSGSAVPDAKITITNTDRNQVVRVVTTDSSGNYSAPILPIGTYTLQVEAPGFKAVQREGIVLNVNDNKKINITLEVGATSESVTVHESAVGVELGTPASATTIEGTQIRELSLNTRNYEQLVSLMPGVVANPTDELYIGNSSPAGTAATLPYSINGNRNSANNWTVDGADNVDRGSNLTLMTFPSVDAISQFKVERSLYTADTGRAGGAQINVVTKSGTKDFHGSAYEFFRNDALAANNWINNANRVNLVDGSAKVPPLRWNDFGYTLGGPVPLKRLKNKTFFFFSQEFRRIITYTTFNPTLPTKGMLQGAFTQPVCITAVSGGCPAGSAPVTQIPASMINPNSAAYIKDIFSKLPLLDNSTTAGFFPQRNLYNSQQELGRIDHTFSEKFTLWGRFEIDAIPTTEPGGLFTGSAIPNGATTKTDSPGRGYVIHAVNTLRPSVLNEAGFNFSQSAIHSTPIGLTAKVNSPDVNPPEPFPNTQGVIPSVTMTGGSSIVGFGPYHELNRNYAFFDNLTWIRGRHVLKFGFSSNRYNKTENAANQQGSFNFSNVGAPSGTSSFNQSWANFLLGNVASFTMPSMDITPDLWAWQHEAYAQDDFTVSRRLKLYLGVRWSFFGQPTDSHQLLDNFDPALYSAANAPQIDPANGNIVPGTGNNPSLNGIIVGGKNSPFGDKVGNDVYHNFAPRIGLAWDPFGSGKTAIRSGYGIYYDSGLFGTYEQNSFANPPYVQSVTYTNGSFSNISAGTLGVSSAPLGLHATQIPALIPYVQQWSLDVQRQLAQNLVLDVGYFGSKGTHLLGIVDINEAYPGAALAAGLHQPNGNTIFTSADIPRINAVRPYRGFTYINAIESAFDSNYHSLQVSLKKNFRDGGLIGVAYTWSKTLTDNGSDRSNAPQNSYNWHEGEYGPAPFDRQQVLTLNYVYLLPFFRNSHGLVGKALSGWQVTGILSAYTGQAFTVTTSSVDPAGLGNVGNNSAASARPDMVCDPRANQPEQYAGAAQTSAQKLTWFNTACFQPVPQGAVRPGNAGRGTVRGPGFFNWDATLSKNFQLTENRWKLQVRGEAFNVLNWVNPNGFASLNITSTAFGQINSFRAPRRVQLAMKLIF
jgi:hypothetical protein